MCSQQNTTLKMKHISKKFKSNNEVISETFPLSKEKSSDGTLAIFINNPGLHHVAEEIFWNLNDKSLEKCQQINQSSNHLLLASLCETDLPQNFFQFTLLYTI